MLNAQSSATGCFPDTQVTTICNLLVPSCNLDAVSQLGLLLSHHVEEGDIRWQA
jgi:hypothetical protein